MNSLKNRLVSCVLVTFLAATAWGRLYETPEQCDQRYGLEYSQKGPDQFWALSRDYKKNGVTVSIRFIRGMTGSKVAGMVSYNVNFGVSGPGELREKIRDTVSKSWTLLWGAWLRHAKWRGAWSGCMASPR